MKPKAALCLAFLIIGWGLLSGTAGASVDVTLDVAPAQSRAVSPPTTLPGTGADALPIAAAGCALAAIGAASLRTQLRRDGRRR